MNRYLASDIASIDNEGAIDFYDSAQFDGLSRIEMGPLYLTQYYTNREDFLYYRYKPRYFCSYYIFSSLLHEFSLNKCQDTYI